MKLPYQHKFTVAAHRGDSYNHFENTMDAFRAAIAAGADMLETDVRLSKDGEMVLIHDATVDRTSDCRGAVKDMTFAELRALNVGDEVHPAQIPTPAEFFALAKESGVMVNLELKEYFTPGNEERCHKCIELAVALAEEYGLTDKMVFNSFDAHVLEYIHKTYGGKYMLHGFYPYDAMKNVEMNPDEYLYCACIFKTKDKKNFDHLLSKGIEPWVGASMTGQRHLDLCARHGAVLVTTNAPGDTIRKLEELHQR